LSCRLTLKFNFGSGDSARFLHFYLFRKSCNWIQQENCAEEILLLWNFFVHLLSLQVPSAGSGSFTIVAYLPLDVLIFWVFGEEFLRRDHQFAHSRGVHRRGVELLLGLFSTRSLHCVCCADRIECSWFCTMYMQVRVSHKNCAEL
jgi:hypothetical protein